MGFQSTVFIEEGFGVPGEQFTDSPWVVAPWTINSSEEAYNVVGATAYTVTSEGFAQAGSGGSYGFAGILVDPKVYALYGAPGGNPLSPTLVLPNYTLAELMTEGTIIVTLPGAANIGDWVIFDNTTGALDTVVAGASLPSGKSWANAIVVRFTVSGAGLAVIQVIPGIGQPV